MQIPSDFRFSVYEFYIRAEDRILLPEYSGSTIRGAFGSAFKRIACLKGQGCSDRCLMAETCPYGYVFETSPPEGSVKLRNYQDVSKPFLFEPPEDGKAIYDRGEEIVFKLVLIGRAIEYFPYFLVAFRDMGSEGLGKRMGRFALERVKIPEKPKGTGGEIYSKAEGIVKNIDASITWEELIRESEPLKSRLTVRFVTPTRLKYEGKVELTPHFHILMRKLLQRLSTLSYFHCGAELKVDYKGLIQRAEDVKTVSVKAIWRDLKRYSNRQNRHLDISGFVGEVAYQGDIDQFAPFLFLGEYLHVGGGCTYGLGKYILES
jgi:CRISPR-associated endoribonuclease Cas6